MSFATIMLLPCASIISIISRQRFRPSGLTITAPWFSIRKPLDL